MAIILSASSTFAQDIKQSQVPSLVVNNFQQKFPKARDIEWKMDGDLYKVDFETGLLGKDQKSWYDQTGNLVRHKEEISKSDLPKNILAKINAEFSGYRIDDVKKITEGGKETYTLELKKFTKEWKVAFDPEGNILSKIAD
jgi:hypothetical protein